MTEVIEGQISIFDLLGEDEPPKMIHISMLGVPDRSMCGRTLTGKFLGRLDEPGPEVDCVVCVDIAKMKGWL